MKTNLIILCFLLCLLSCQDTKKEEAASKKIQKNENSDYPQDLAEVFKAHGGVAAWKSMKSLEFELMKAENNEFHSINLKNRNTLITSKAFSMGSIGDSLWVKAGASKYKGNAGFYYNLMFYFYAMPFVLGDPGLHYEKTKPLQYEGTSYPGIKIGFKDGVGASPKDEYYLYYDEKSHKMAWLGYTVTYQSGKASDDIHLIKYEAWQEVKDIQKDKSLLLPKTLVWYGFKNEEIGKKQQSLSFNKVKLSENKPAAGTFKIPKGAKIIKGKKP